VPSGFAISTSAWFSTLGARRCRIAKPLGIAIHDHATQMIVHLRA
jgi:hypothetical protein